MFKMKYSDEVASSSPLPVTANTNLKRIMSGDNMSEIASSVGEGSELFELPDADDNWDVKYVPSDSELSKQNGKLARHHKTSTSEEGNHEDSTETNGDQAMHPRIALPRRDVKIPNPLVIYPWLEDVDKMVRRIVGAIVPTPSTALLDTYDYLIG